MGRNEYDATHVRGVPAADLERWLLDAGLRPTRLFEEDGRTFAFASPL